MSIPLIIGPSHLLVSFVEDGYVSCVPKKLVVSPSQPTAGDSCSVRWSDGVEYAATVVAMGELVPSTHCGHMCAYLSVICSHACV